MASVAPRLASSASPLRLASALLVAACSADPGAPAAPLDAAPADVAAPPPDVSQPPPDVSQPSPDAAPDVAADAAPPDVREPPADAVVASDATAPDATAPDAAAPDAAAPDAAAPDAAAPDAAAPDAAPADAPPDVDPRMLGTFRFGVEAALNLVIEANGTYRWHRDDCAVPSGACGRWTRSGDMIALSGATFGDFPWVVGTLAEPVATARVSLAADGSGVVVRGMGGGRGGRPFEQTWTRGAACAQCAGGMQSGPPTMCTTAVPTRCGP